jgi:hypothetical protein
VIPTRGDFSTLRLRHRRTKCSWSRRASLTMMFRLAGVGFVALFGIAVMNGVVLVAAYPPPAALRLRPADGGLPGLARVRHPLLRLRPCPLQGLRPGICHRVLVQGPRGVPLVQRSAHGTDRRPSCRSRHLAGARATVGDFGAEAEALKLAGGRGVSPGVPELRRRHPTGRRSRLGDGLRRGEKNATAAGFGELAATGPSRPKCPLSLLISSP